MALQTRAQIRAKIDSLLASNTTGAISAADVREVVGDIADSMSSTPDTTKFILPLTDDIPGTTIDAAVDVIETLAESSVGDGGGRVFRRAVSEPTAAHKKQSADGTWWNGDTLAPLPEPDGGTGATSLGAASVTPTGGTHPAQVADMTPLHIEAFKDGDVDFTGQTDEAPTLRAAFAAAASSGRELTCDRDGILSIASKDSDLVYACGVHVAADSNLNVRLPRGLVLRAEQSLYTAVMAEQGFGGVIRFDSPSGTSGVVGGVIDWRGGVIDCERVTGANADGDGGATLTGLDGFSVGAAYRVALRDIFFDAGETVPANADVAAGGGGDSAIHLKEIRHGLMEGCRFRGWPDCGIYLSGDTRTDREGEDLLVSACEFERVGFGFAAKRGFRRHSVIGCNFYECGSGISALLPQGDVLEQTARTFSWVGNTMEKIQNWPFRCQDASVFSVTGNVVKDWGRLVEDGGERSVSVGNYAAAFRAEGCSFGTITGNTFAMIDWTPTLTVSKDHRGFHFAQAASGNDCSWIRATNNVLIDVAGEFIVSAGSTNNTISDNSVRAAT